MRIAWFSPMPPVRTGIADCSAELVGALHRRGHDIDAYPAASAHDFPWVHRQRPYDFIVYQFGNSSHHDYQWAYALRYPGLVVLHDACLHHARAAFLLRERRAADYRAEFAWSHPDVPRDAAELAVAGLDSRLFYEWPLIRGVVETSRMVGVHGSAVRSPIPASRPLVPIRLGHGEFVAPDRRRDARARIRARYAIAEDAVVFGLFGGLTPEKRIPQVLDAMRALIRQAPAARLLLGGASAAHFDAAAAIDDHGLREYVIRTGYLPDDELTDHLAACDVSLNLRWPTAREISGVWLRALAAGVPTIITDLVHLAGVPSLDPRTWTKNQEVGGGRLEVGIAVAIDILDEDHSLRVAMKRLARDPELRAQLGRDGQAWWQREHSLDAMVEDYERIFREAPASAAETPRRDDLPAHFRPTGEEQLRQLLQPFGIDSPL
jgi:glycosyltransferase involved in cell wall biosynthesis